MGIEHGVGSVLYNKWGSMKTRCYYPKSKDYKNYGGRGIKICDEWLNYDNFRNWSISTGYQEGLTIDRIDNDRNYEPSNCKWITMKEQQRNKRNNRIITYNGKSLTLVEWGEIYNINPDRIGARLKNGWSVEDALSTEVKSPMKKKIENLGLEMKKYRKENNMTQKDLADIFEVRHSLVSRWENGQRCPTTKHIEKIKKYIKNRRVMYFVIYRYRSN